MNFLKLCVREPVIAIVISLVLLVLGVAAYSRLDMSYLPTIKVPVVTIAVSYPGAPAELMESRVANLLEGQLGGVDGVESISSTSTSASTSVTVNFKLGGDFDTEVSQVRDKVNAATADQNWPGQANRPTINVGMRGMPMMVLAFDDPSKDADEMRDYIINVVSKIFLQVPGVAGADVKGGSSYVMRIWLDPAKMQALGVSVGDVESKLKAENIDVGGGSIVAPQRTYSIISHTRFKNPQDFRNLVIRKSDQGSVRLGDISKVEFTSSEIDMRPMRVNGKEASMLIITPTQGVNPLKLDKQLKQKITQLKSSLPQGMTMRLIDDSTTFLRTSIQETFITIAEAVVLVILVVLAFLGSLRAAIIPIVTIPVSLISVFAVIAMLGFSINVMSLLAIVLAIGLVVDDAIVMLENIHRHIENGIKPLDAALIGIKEMAAPVCAMSLTLIAVYAPIGMVTGVTAILSQQFAFTLAAAVLISGIVALTLSPMMSSRLLKSEHGSNKITAYLDKLFDKLSNFYSRILGKALNIRFVVLCGLVLVGAIGFVLLRSLPSELLPQEDQGSFNVVMRAPAGSRMPYTDVYIKQVEKMIMQLPDVATVMTQGDPTNPVIRVFMKPWGKRHATPSEYVTKLNQSLKQVTGVYASAYLDPVIQTSTSNTVDYNIMTNNNYTQLMQVVNQFMARLKSYPGLVNLVTDLKFDSQQFTIQVNRDLASQLGVSMDDVNDTISTMVGSKQVTDVASGQSSYSVILQMRQSDLGRFDLMNKLFVRGKGADGSTKLIPLSTLVTLKPTIGQSSMAHFNRMRSATISAGLAPGTVMSEAVNKISSISSKHLTGGYFGSFSGKAQQYLESAGTMGGVVLLAFVFIYLVLAAQFRSFIDPLAILLAVPLSLVGAALMLMMVGGTLNLYSEVGMVTLIGLISKHGILITQFTNQLRAQGVNVRDALLQATSIRLRPILMTTAAMVFGTLPLALATGPGSAGREQIGAVLVGGLLVGTFFSLFVVPVMYSYLSRFRKPPKIIDSKSEDL